jgi:diapolycopene oxygenase
MAGYSIRDLFRLDWWRSMHGGVSHYVKHPRLRDVLDFFIKYVGSSAYRAPGFMNLMPTIQFRYKLWYVDGGLYGIAEGLRKLIDELGIRLHLSAEVAAIETDSQGVTGVKTQDGTVTVADYVVSNMEAIPAYDSLLGEDKDFTQKLFNRFEPACSGLVLDIGVNKKYPQLAHHNFFFSGDQKKHFASVFEKKRIPEDPTLYVVAASRTDPTIAPQGCELIKILPHIPYIDPENPVPESEYKALRGRILEKMERMGLEGLRNHIIHEHMLTPYDIRKMYYSNRGSIYGVVTDRWKNFGLKIPKQSTKYPNLFFVGGSVNPGGGMPMVILCGQNVCDRLVAYDEQNGR